MWSELSLKITIFSVKGVYTETNSNRLSVSTMISQFAQTHAIVPIKASHFIGDLTTPKDKKRVENCLLQINF